MREINTKLIENAVYGLALNACVKLTDECAEKLCKAKKNETNELAAFALGILNENNRLAMRERIPVCQDTGLAVVVIEVGDKVCFTGDFIVDAVNEGIRRAYKDGYFRKSACDPFSRENTLDNLPVMLTTEYVRGDKVKISFMAKGFGSENMSKLYMLNPSEGEEGILAKITETVKIAGGNPCPPIIVGVGVGGTFDKCALLAKKALMRHITSFNSDSRVRKLEEKALENINALGVGAQGLGGNTTALKVNIEYMPTHIAGLPVAINIQCHCERKSEIEL